jgi:putative endonuclease
LKDTFLHIGKLDDMFWALSESFNALGDYFNRFGVYLIYMSTYSQSGNWFVYIIRCADSTLYTGISTNVARRFEEHASSSPRSAKYLRGRAPLELIYAKEIGTQSEATIEERRIKALTKTQKLNLIVDLT